MELLKDAEKSFERCYKTTNASANTCNVFRRLKFIYNCKECHIGGLWICKWMLLPHTRYLALALVINQYKPCSTAVISKSFDIKLSAVKSLTCNAKCEIWLITFLNWLSERFAALHSKPNLLHNKAQPAGGNSVTNTLMEQK